MDLEFHFPIWKSLPAGFGEFFFELGAKKEMPLSQSNLCESPADRQCMVLLISLAFDFVWRTA